MSSVLTMIGESGSFPLHLYYQTFSLLEAPSTGKQLCSISLCFFYFVAPNDVCDIDGIFNGKVSITSRRERAPPSHRRAYFTGKSMFRKTVAEVKHENDRNLLNCVPVALWLFAVEKIFQWRDSFHWNGLRKLNSITLFYVVNGSYMLHHHSRPRRGGSLPRRFPSVSYFPFPRTTITPDSNWNANEVSRKLLQRRDLVN